MGFLDKLGIAVGGTAARQSTRSLPQERNAVASGGRGGTVAAGSPRAPELKETARVSNGLKEFLWNLDGLGHGTLLDLGPAWQTTLSFFIERGFRVSSEDILREWKGFLSEEELRLRDASPVPESLDMTPTGRATRFLGSNLQYPRASFDAVLVWDLIDYLEPALAKQTIANLTEIG